MAAEKNITMKQYNGTDYDTLYPETTIEQVEDLSNQFLLSNVTYYVSASGSDTNGDGTSSNPFATVNHAVSLIPKNLNGYTVIIHIVGNLTQNIVINNFHGGTFSISGDKTNVITGSLGFSACYCSILVTKIAQFVGTVTIEDCPVCKMYMANTNAVTFDGDNNQSCLVVENSNLDLNSSSANPCTFTNATYGIYNTSSFVRVSSGALIDSTVSTGIFNYGRTTYFYGTNNASTKRNNSYGIILENGVLYPIQS